MKNLNFTKAIAFFLANYIFLISLVTFSGCSQIDDFTALKEETQGLNLRSNITLSELDKVIVNLKDHVFSKNSLNNDLNPSYADNLPLNFGEIKWAENRVVTYENGYKVIFIPIIKDGLTSAFIVSLPNEKSFKSVIIQVISENQESDIGFSGKMNYFSIEGENIISFTYKNGQNVFDGQNTSLKSGVTSDGCHVQCVYDCFNSVMTRDWLYGTACGIACVGFETGIGLFICMICVGGPALYCLDNCCPGTID